jgi:hypothetical protein
MEAVTDHRGPIQLYGKEATHFSGAMEYGDHPERNVVRDANGQALVFVYGRPTREEAEAANLLTTDEARRLAVNITRLPKLLEES